MKLVFCGTPEFAVPTLRAVLNAGHEVALVLTQPDRPAGRKMELHSPPVKQLALEHGLPIMQPERIRKNDELRATLESIHPDAILVVAYGRIIPEWMLQLPRFGNINLHGSLLPKYQRTRQAFSQAAEPANSDPCARAVWLTKPAPNGRPVTMPMMPLMNVVTWLRSSGLPA